MCPHPTAVSWRGGKSKWQLPPATRTSKGCGLDIQESRATWTLPATSGLAGVARPTSPLNLEIRPKPHGRQACRTVGWDWPAGAGGSQTGATFPAGKSTWDRRFGDGSSRERTPELRRWGPPHLLFAVTSAGPPLELVCSVCRQLPRGFWYSARVSRQVLPV